MDTYIDPYFRLTESAEQHKYLYHYTNMDAFEKIVRGGKLKLKRLDKMEDKGENEFLSKFWQNKVFACCFTHSEEGKERFWREYAKNDGVRIEFPNHLLIRENYRIVSENGYEFPKITRTDPGHKLYNSDEDWGLYDVSKVDILYLSAEERESWRGKSNGLAKNSFAESSYDWEEETRIRIAMRPVGWEERLDKTNNFVPMQPFFDEMYIELNVAILCNISVSIPSAADDQFVCKVKNILAKNPMTKDCAINRLG